jgi:hypothetical protein
MLCALRRVSTNTRVVGTLVAFSVGIVAAVVARADDGDMTSTVRVTLGATRVEAGALWRDRPAVILVLRRPG